MIEFRPCGACAALVPADTGCGHWRPVRQVGQGATTKRERDVELKRAARARAREQAKQAVDEFRRTMTRGVRG